MVIVIHNLVNHATKLVNNVISVLMKIIVYRAIIYFTILIIIIVLNALINIMELMKIKLAINVTNHA